MHRYNNIDHILNMDLEDGLEMIKMAYDKQLEDKLWERWLVDYTNMDKDSFITFEDYKDKILNTNKKENNSEEVDVKAIIAEAEEIKRIDQKGG